MADADRKGRPNMPTATLAEMKIQLISTKSKPRAELSVCCVATMGPTAFISSHCVAAGAAAANSSLLLKLNTPQNPDQALRLVLPCERKISYFLITSITAADRWM